MDLYAKRTPNLDTENAFKIGSHISAIEHTGNPVIKLNLGEPDFNIPDFVKNEIKKQLDLNNTHYCDPKGILSLRKAIGQQLFQTRGLSYSPEQIVVFPGAKPSIGFSQEVYCNPGDEIIYPSPGFPIYESFIRYLGAIPVPIHLKEDTGFTFNAEHLAQLITPKTKLIFINFPSNPTGGVASLGQLEAISQVILKNCHPNVRVYSDEIYEHIIFNGQKNHSIASLPGMQERTIISSGFSKSYAWTGGRIGYAAFPTIEEAEVFKNLNINYFSCIPAYNQEGAREALENPESPLVLSNMVKLFEERSTVIHAALNALPGVRCQKPKGAFYLFPNISGVCEHLGAIELYHQLDEAIRFKTTPSTLVQMFALYHHYVAVMDRKSFGKIGIDGMHFLRLSTAADLSVLEAGVERLAHAFEDKKGFEAFVKRGQYLF
jgi:aspartate/methionine/tyrosine aminotransferase